METGRSRIYTIHPDNFSNDESIATITRLTSKRHPKSVTPINVKAPYVVCLRLERNVVNRISLSPIDPFPVYPGFDGNVKEFFLFDVRDLII